MRRRVKWTPTAKNRLQEIKEYIAQSSEKYALLKVQQIYDKAINLAKNDYDGRPIPELNDKNIRQVLHQPYRIIYWIISPDEIHILTIWHGAIPFDPEQELSFDH